MAVTDQLEYTRDELLSTHTVAEPLIVGGVRCHGGFLDEGTYVSPRTKHRAPALLAWQENHRQTFGVEPLHAPVETWPGNYPNLEQARFLLRNGVPEPVIVALTRIGTVEGFGAMIRFLAPEDMQQFITEDIRGTATDHLGRGLVEAHARDEAGYGDEAGHDKMWFAARDVAFENPVTEDQTALMLERLGIAMGGGSTDPAAAMQRFMARRTFDDLDMGLEMLVSTMLRVLFVEIKAFHVFSWAEDLLGDVDLVAGDGAAGRLVEYIKADEAPHVEYLRTSLSEMRVRTFKTTNGGQLSGEAVIDELWQKGMEESLGMLEEQNRSVIAREVELTLGEHPRGRDLLEEFHSLGDVRPDTDGHFVPVDPDAVGVGY
jgi:hypothetical protein